MQKLQFKSHFSTFYATCRFFLQKYIPPDASNFEKKYMY